jgi:hypothetical protein
MNDINQTANRTGERDLERVIEPLASYICATDRPQTALKLALSVLLSQVEQTNRIANARVAAFLEGRLAVPA